MDYVILWKSTGKKSTEAVKVGRCHFEDYRKLLKKIRDVSRCDKINVFSTKIKIAYDRNGQNEVVIVREKYVKSDGNYVKYPKLLLIVELERKKKVQTRKRCEFLKEAINIVASRER